MRKRWIFLTGFLIAGALIGYLISGSESLRTQQCVAKVGSTRVTTDLEQAKWASFMAAEAHARNLPARATTIAIATAYQESKLHNIDYGDRDSVGLFQQRPSQGWGSEDQILDPVYAIGRFYDALAKVKGYTDMEITEAAQAVQISGFPDAYADHEADARALASALRGESPAAFWCEFEPRHEGSTDDVTAMFTAAYGDVEAKVKDSVVTLPVTGKNADTVGWSYAQFAVANAYELKIAKVSFNGMSWTAEDSDKGWVAANKAAASAVTITVG